MNAFNWRHTNVTNINVFFYQTSLSSSNDNPDFLFIFFFCHLRFIKGTRPNRGQSPIQESKNINIRPKQQADIHKNFWAVSPKRKPLGKKASSFHHVADCPAINGHVSRRETNLFLRCQRDVTTELRRRRNINEGESVQPNGSQLRPVEGRIWQIKRFKKTSIDFNQTNLWDSCMNIDHLYWWR